MIIAPALRTSDYFSIVIQHLATKQRTFFEGWVTEFSDKFTSDWNEVPVYGRMDPLVTFRGTKRNISLSFDVVADTQGQAIGNLELVNRLITFLYPVYEQQAGTRDQRVGQTLKAAPLVSLQWTNLISNAFDGYPLVGYLGGVTYNPDMNQGGFVDSAINAAGGHSGRRISDTTKRLERILPLGEKTRGMPLEGAPEGTRVKQTADKIQTWKIPMETMYVPKVLNISLEFGVLHQHLNGFIRDETGDYSFSGHGSPSRYPNSSKTVSGETPGTVYKHTFTYVDQDGNKIEDVRRREVSQLYAAGQSQVLSDELINEGNWYSGAEVVDLK